MIRPFTDSAAPKKSARGSIAAVPPPSSSAGNNQLLLPSKIITHHPKAGLNPLVDTAAYLFSVIGKLKNISSYQHLNQLQIELLQEINTFQEAAKAHGYHSEYILVSRYALCATIDDIILNTAWGAQGQWEEYNLLTTVNQESSNPERFFLILNRISKDPQSYIDVMELMYICLSLGFKGNYRTSEYNNNQLEQITNSLYKHIRAYQGDFSKTLSPFPVKTPLALSKPKTKKHSFWMTMLVTVGIVLGLFLGLEYLLNGISEQAFRELMYIGKTAPYENHEI